MIEVILESGSITRHRDMRKAHNFMQYYNLTGKVVKTSGNTNRINEEVEYKAGKQLNKETI